MKNNKNALIIIYGIILFYIVPYIAPKILPSDAGLLFYIVSLLLVNSAYSVLSCYIAAKNRALQWVMPLCIGALFAPSIFLFYNSSAWIYPAIYVLLGYVSTFVAGTARKS